MTPRLVVRYFGPGRELMWERLTNVLAYTARVHCQGWRIDIASIAPREELASPRGVQGYVWNTHKLDAWNLIVQAAPDGEPLLLLDADTAILRPLDDAWTHEFDVAYTVKPEDAHFPFNGGVVFLRATPAAKQFMSQWQSTNRFFLDNPLEFDVWRNFGGLNQASLGAVLRRRQHEAVVKKLPCLEWNCEDEHWARFDPEVTRILHCKSHLQRAIFRMAKPEDGERPLVELWRRLEAAYMNDKPAKPAKHPGIGANITGDVGALPGTFRTEPEPPEMSSPVGPDQDTQITSDSLEQPEASLERPTHARRPRRGRQRQQPSA